MIKRIISILMVVILSIALVACGEENNKEQAKTENTTKQETKKEEATPSMATDDSGLKVHFINVGQADSILVQQGSHFMMVDAGNNDDEGTIKSYLNEVGVKDFEYVVGTHAHEDHIGSLDYIINSFKIGKIYFPKQTATTKTFENVLTATKNKGMQFNGPKVGETFNLGDAKCTILAPNGSGYKDGNDYSIVIKVDYGNTSFLLTGDAEALSEKEMLSNGLNLKADVLKIGHHGSSSSTSSEFLNAVNPKYGVVSVGKDNSYGHPNQGTMDRLKNKGIKVFRTDEQGTIVATSNGKEITFNVNAGSYNGLKGSSPKSSSANSSTNPGVNNSQEKSSGGNTTNEPAPKGKTVYWTPKGKSYHYRRDCQTLARSKTINEGDSSTCPKKDPCDKCAK